MFKKLPLIFLALSMYSTSLYPMGSLLPSLTPAEAEKMAEAAGRGIVKGFGNEAGNLIGNADPKTTAKLFQSIFSGSGQALNTKEFKELTKTVGNAVAGTMVDVSKGLQSGSSQSIGILNETMKDGSKQFGKGIDESMSIAGKQMQETFKSGGEIDKGLSQGVSLYTRNINRGIQSLVHNNAMKASAIFLTTVGTFFTLQYGIPFAVRMIERQLMRPKLIISSYKKGFWQSLFGIKPKENPMIFTPTLENRLNNIVTVTTTIQKKINQGKTNVKYRNLMLYGAPGTGKTLFATELAKRCGLEYVSMSGSSFSKFKDGEGIEALDELFAWANKSQGLLIFIDEAEAFLSKRENMDPQSKSYQLLNNFLNYTGTRSNKFMLVFATNHKDVLDSAMYRRIDDLVEVPLPGLQERIRLLELYKDIILMDAYQNEALFVQSVCDVLKPNIITTIAQKTKGLSGSDLEGIMNALKTDADILDPAVITHSLVDTVVQQAIDKHNAFTNGKALGFVEN